MNIIEMRRVVTKSFCLLIFFLCCTISQAQTPDSLDIKIGQMILIGLPQAKVDSSVLKAVQSGRIGSILFFEKNIPARNSYIELKKIIWTYQKAAKIPLFISIDQEGGRVNRLKEKYGFPRSVTAAKLGNYPIDSVRFYSQITANTLAALGFNVNFAPVVDLALDPTNVIAKPERSFSARADSVSMFAREVIRQHRKVGVITVLKHFPGHGSAKDDTHLGMADVTKVWTEAELVPYKLLIDSGNVDAIMTAHIVNKKLDAKGLPATLSAKITNDILRKKLHYEGVVFSDDMQMHAIAKHYSLEESILFAIRAGVDILLFSNNIQGSQDRTIDKVHGIIRNLVEKDSISVDRIDESYRRIITLKQRITDSSEEYLRKELVKMEQEAMMMQKRAEDNAQLAREQEKHAQEMIEQLKKENQKLTKKGKKKKQT